MTSQRSGAQCRICGSGQQRVFAEVSAVPVHTTILWPTRERALQAPLGDLQLIYCNECGHIYNALFDERKTEYTEAYDNSLHFSPLFQSYAESLASELIARHGLKGGSVVEIGCGKGDFLALLLEKGVGRAIGFDPSYVDVPEHEALIRSERLSVKREFYTAQTSDQLAHLIVCRQVLEHLSDPRGFLSGIRASLGSSGTTPVFFEVPNALSLLRDLDIWTIIYEHPSIFTPESLARLFELSGFSVNRESELFEGIFLGIEARPSPSQLVPTPRRAQLKELSAYVDRFSKGFRAKLSGWQARLEAYRQQQSRVVIWGGGARGVTFLNMLKPGSTIPYVVDLNPRKQGTFAGGSGQEYVAPAFLCEFRPDVVVLMNSIYEREVKAMLSDLGVHAELISA